jgi:uncharacterized phiE125 gp8 family phage protein
MKAPVRTSAPATTPITVAETKAHLRVSHTAEDTLIGTYLDAATAHLDGWHGILGRCMVTQTWRQDLEGFSTVMDMPFPDAASVSVAYYDADNVSQTLAGTNYNLVNGNGRAWLQISESGNWPVTYDRPDAVQITATYGYGAAAAVPANLKAAIMLHVGVMFGARADGELPQAYHALIAPHRVVGM